jgi:hypothetical protein
VIGGIGDEPLGELVQCYGHTGLQANGEKSIGRDMVVVLNTIE